MTNTHQESPVEGTALETSATQRRTLHEVSEPDSVAIVTGGAGTLGRAIAANLATRVQTVVIVDLSSTNVMDTAAEFASGSAANVTGAHLDVSDATANAALMSEIAERYGRLDYLINNAAISQRTAFGDITEEEWARAMAVNLWGPASLAQAAAPLLRSGGGGAIVNISSRTWATGGPLSYVTSKAGIVGMTRSLAVELAPANIRVNAVAPSMVETPFVRNGRSETEYGRLIQRQRSFSLLPRLATADDVAEAVSFLASPRSSFITGEVLHVAGGGQLAPPP
ncbi:SDR family NAD(P)-dependent oxidoreductase [Nocardioides immobilis]|uniref:SDR family NAD(P)-dependent oxidoreductase n=1 Tax=Nocardioides immobilis TaxID=2049295 RepID=UPI0015FD4C8C|nr:SDR family oxidoreductase [Nocardioides immobilis]